MATSTALNSKNVPIIDYSQLTSSNPQQYHEAIQCLEIACKDWGIFMLINHGVPESVMKALMDGYTDFFNSEEKHQYSGGGMWSPVEFGSIGTVIYGKSRAVLKTIVHPQFHFVSKPNSFSEVARDYCTRTRVILLELLKAISKTVSLEKTHIEKAMNLKSGLTILAGNYYPPCLEPTVGLQPHTDIGLLTFMYDNGVEGFQIQHNDQWLNFKPIPNCIVVNVADQLQILTNGKYKSNMHRVVMDNKPTRISIAMANGSSLDTIVHPAKELTDDEPISGHSPMYNAITYKEYLELKTKMG